VSDAVARAVAKAWRIQLPPNEATALLRACLLEGERGTTSWKAFEGAVGDVRMYFERDTRGLKGLLPFIADSIERQRLEVHGTFRTYARVALVREELRGSIYYDVLRAVCAALDTEKIAYRLLRGAAIAKRFYATPLARHNHAIDLLIRAADTARVHDALSAQGFTVDDTHSYRHPTGLPLVLHTHLFEHPYAKEPGGFSTVNACGHLLEATDLLLHTIGCAAYNPSNSNLRWVADAWHLISNSEALDWNAYVHAARSSGFALFHAVALAYVRDAFGPPVPTDVIAALEVPDRTESERDLCQRLYASLMYGGCSYRRAWLALNGPIALRIRFAIFALFPPAEYLHWRYALSGTGAVLRWRVVRPVRMARRLARGRPLNRRQHAKDGFADTFMDAT
jgi:Uncharacterised nucleotidyltransferase